LEGYDRREADSDEQVKGSSEASNIIGWLTAKLNPGCEVDSGIGRQPDRDTHSEGEVAARSVCLVK
jgi:hypothetical protein